MDNLPGSGTFRQLDSSLRFYRLGGVNDVPTRHGSHCHQQGHYVERELVIERKHAGSVDGPCEHDGKTRRPGGFRQRADGHGNAVERASARAVHRVIGGKCDADEDLTRRGEIYRHVQETSVVLQRRYQTIPCIITIFMIMRSWSLAMEISKTYF